MTPARRNLATVAAAVLAWLAFTAWVRPLMLPDEGRYVGVAWEMLRSGEWFTPTLDGLPYFHKPPLFYWITGGSLALFGLHEWAGRLAPMLGATLAGLSLYLFARRWASERVARWSLVVLMVQPMFFIGGQFANLDMLVAGCITATILALAHAALDARDDRPARGAVLLGYGFAALGVLAKGLIGAVLPGLVIVVWLLLLGRWRVLLRLLSLPGLVLFGLLAGPWFVVMQSRFADFFDYFFIVQHFKRFADTGFNNAQPFWFYPAVLAVITLPWFAWLARALRRGYWADTATPATRPVRLLMALWLVLIVGFFSLPQSKLVGYVLPAIAPLAFLIADAAVSGPGLSRRLRQLWQASAGLAVALCLGALALVVAYPQGSQRELGRTLASAHSAGEPVLFLHDYYFDLAFYARLREPVRVVEDWTNPAYARADDWRRELRDAAVFVPTATPVLFTPDDVPTLLCGAPVTWVVAEDAMAQRYPALQQARKVGTAQEVSLWRLERAAISATCPGTPSANSARTS